jgi:precorrin-2 dehydrogenase/sirohydrochlorin ferrochelatase
MLEGRRVRNEPPVYPVALRLEGVPCLVVGAGHVAVRKVTSLIECDAKVTVIAPRMCPEMERLRATLLPREYEAGDAEHYRLVITATGLPEVDRAVFRDCELAGVLVNAADDVEACRFFVPSVLRRGPVTVAVSTAGTSPFLAGWIRRRIAEVVGPEFATVAAILGDARQALRRAGRSTETADWSSLVDEKLISTVAAGRDHEARQRVATWLAGELGV